MQPSNFTPVCIEYQQKIRDYFNWKIEDDEYVLTWLNKNISNFHPIWSLENRNKNLHDISVKLGLMSNDKFVVIGANITENETLELSDNDALIIADGAVGSIIELNEKLIKNIICIVSDGDGLPYISNKKIENIPIILHAHGHAKNNLNHILNIWSMWENPPKIIISHQISNDIEGAVNFGGFSDGDRAVCMLHAYGIKKENITLKGFDIKKVGRWSGLTNSKIKQEKLKWMQEILEVLGHDI